MAQPAAWSEMAKRQQLHPEAVSNVDLRVGIAGRGELRLRGQTSAAGGASLLLGAEGSAWPGRSTIYADLMSETVRGDLRAYANAILAAVDAVEGKPSGRD